MTAKKFLFANFPGDGHFLPLTGIAMELKNQGHDVRWYTSKIFEEKIGKMNIHYYPFKKALDVHQFNINEVFPERKNIKSGVPQLKFDIKNMFVRRGPEYFSDIQLIYQDFPFDALVSDIAFTGAEYVKNILKVKHITVGVLPVMSTSKDLPPYGMALLPNKSIPGKIKNSMLRFVAKNMLFKESTKEYNSQLVKFGLKPHKDIIFDLPAKLSDGYLQSGVPGFEYDRSDYPTKMKFVGHLRAYKSQAKKPVSYDWAQKIGIYEKAILISQGTYEPDHKKLIIPALEALKDTRYLLIVTTGHHYTKELRKMYQKNNIIIEDFIDFDFIMPKVDIYITNGGYGGTLQAIDHALPMLCAGINEGKNEICARVGYFKLGINLNKECPQPAEIRSAITKMIENPEYKSNITKLNSEFKQYDAHTLSVKHILKVLAN